MNTIAGLLLVAAAAVAQVSIAPAFSIFGALPNLVLVVLVAWIAVRGKREALPLIPAGGVLLGLFDSQPLGVAVLALAPVIVMAEVPEMRLVESNLAQAVLIIICATVLYEVAFLLTLAVTGEQVDWLAAGVDVVAPAALANSLVLLPVFGMFRLAAVRDHRPAY